jgi:hypothetical protein
MSEAGQIDDARVDVLITYHDPDHVATISDGMETAVPPRILGPPVGELPALVLAGSVAIRVLVNGLVEWTQKVKGTTLVVTVTKKGKVTVQPEDAANVVRVIVVGPDGETQFSDLTGGKQKEIEDLIKAAVAKALGA